MIVLLNQSEKDHLPVWKYNVIKFLIGNNANIAIIYIDSKTPSLSIFYKIEKCLRNKDNFIRNDLRQYESTSTINKEILNLSATPHKEISYLYPDSSILEYYYNGNNIAALGSIGEYEIVNRKSSIKISLIKINANSNYTIVESCDLILTFSAIRNLYNAQNECVNLIKRHYINKNHHNNSNAKIAHNIIPKSLILRYHITFYNQLIHKCYNIFKGHLLKKHNEHWTVGLGKSPFMESNFSDVIPINIPDKEFWADPFLYTHKNKTYLFFERYPFNSCKGVISVGEVRNNTIEDVRDVLIRPYHLSYPNVFEHDGEIFMIPECSANRCIEIWRATDFPNKWELYSSGFHDKNMADTVFYADKDGNKWLFSSEAVESPDEHCYKLSLFKIDGLKLGEIKEHPASPIVIDCSCARNGGRIFELNGHIYRTAQDNRYGEYGHGVAIMEITVLNENEYKEHLVYRLDHPICPKMLGTHHMTESGGLFVIDICTKR